MADDLEIRIGSNPSGVEQGSRRAKAAIKGVADGGRDLDSALRRLRQSIDPTYAALEKYNKIHADNLALLRAGMVSRREYNAAMRVAKQALDAETAAIQRNSAAGQAASQEARARNAAQRQEQRAAQQAAAQAQRELAAAQRQAQREAQQAAQQAAAAEKAAIRAAAQEAKQLAKEVAAAERQAKREAAQAAKEAAQAATAAAREKTRAERIAAKEIAEAQRRAHQEAVQASRQAAKEAAAAASARRKADRDAARASREAAQATSDQARAERVAAQSAHELRASIDPAYASLSRYNETMRVATRLLMENKLKQGEWVAIQKQAKTQMDINVRSMGRMNSVGVQLGYQMQDVAASLASGINPLVILAQQGGQTASALAQMGGTVGKVASVMGGVWVQAALAVIVVLGQLWQSEEEGERVTKDLMYAEDRRAMTVRELTDSLRDYIRTQQEANNTTLEGLRLQVTSKVDARDEARRALTKKQEELREAEEQLKTLREAAIADPDKGNAAALARQLSKVSDLRKQVNALQAEVNEANTAVVEANIGYAQGLSGMDELEKDHQRRVQGLTDTYRASAHTLNDYNTYQRGLTEETKRYTAAKERESKAHKDNKKAAEEEAKAVFQSREQAIGIAGNELRKKGFSVTENYQFGGVHANHPGMGNDAHGRYALDINMPGGEAGPVAQKKMEEMVRAYQARGFRVLWNGKVYEPLGNGPSYDIKPGSDQHKDHAHIEAPKSIVGKPAGGSLGSSTASAQLREEEDLRKQAFEAFVEDLEYKKELNQDDLGLVLKIQDEKLAAIRDFYGEDSREFIRAQREKQRIEREKAREELQIKRDAIQQKLSLDQLASDTEVSLRESARQREAQQDEFMNQMGLMSDKELLDRKKARMEEEYQEEIDFENRMYQLKVQSLRDELALENLRPEERRRVNAEIEQEEAQHQAKMKRIQSEHATQVQQINQENAKLSSAKWVDMAQTVGQQLSSSLQGFWNKSLTIRQALLNLADSIVFKFFDMGARIVQDWIMRQFTMTAVQQAQDAARVTSAVAAEGIKTGATISGAATSTAVTAAAAGSEITSHAATAAAGAYKSTVVIPFIGPIAAPVAAGLALAAVLGFASMISAEGGAGEITRDGQLAQLHKKEMVLPAWIAEPMRQSLRSPGSSGMFGGAMAAGSSMRDSITNGQNNFYHQPKYGGSPEPNMKRLLSRDGKSLKRWLINEARNGRFNQGMR